MKTIYNNIIPFPGFAAINLFGVIFARKKYRPLSETTVNHEAIHTEQMKELLYVGFYLCYLVEWIVRLFMKGKPTVISPSKGRRTTASISPDMRK
jgi:hypothetical protein